MDHVAWGSWQITPLPGWVVVDDEECLGLVKSEEGAFQLSSAIKSDGTTNLVDLEAFYRPTIPIGATFHPVTFGDFSGYVAEFLDIDTMWRKYWLLEGNLLVFATYNGSPKAWKSERGDVHHMLGSLRRAAVLGAATRA